MNKNIKNKCCLVITGSINTKKVLLEQLLENFGGEIDIKGVAIDARDDKITEADYYIFSSKELYEEVKAKQLIDSQKPYYIAERAVNFQSLDKVTQVPAFEKVLFVNDSKATAEGYIDALINVGIDHIDYIPYYPGVDLSPYDEKEFKIVITAGEREHCPNTAEQIIDVGSRIIEISSMLKIAEIIDVKDYDYKKIIKPYTEHIVKISKRMAIIDDKMSKLNKTLRNELKQQGYIANYRFEDILGKSKEIEASKTRAKKLAVTDLSILIEGESGTGKELMASAIHNASTRKDGPFLAVNFSALTEELVESELFGYVEGAFTGAIKGGKKGLFEKADGGTIFLDEIGEISPKIQTKLLRVLQEKEIMPVGGHYIKKVDIRIIAATNKNLKEMVSKETFRSDLYYRLNMGYIYIPPLRDRKGDIWELAEFFIEKELKGKGINIEGELKNLWLNYRWEGNVREVENVVKYMLAIREKEHMLTVEDLPDSNYFINTKITPGERSAIFNKGVRWEDEYSETDEAIGILKSIEHIRKKSKIPGRQTIAKELIEYGIELTEAQVRNRLYQLEDGGYIRSFKGKRGVALTEKGYGIIKK